MPTHRLSKMQLLTILTTHFSSQNYCDKLPKITSCVVKKFQRTRTLAKNVTIHLKYLKHIWDPSQYLFPIDYKMVSHTLQLVG